MPFMFCRRNDIVEIARYPKYLEYTVDVPPEYRSTNDFAITCTEVESMSNRPFELEVFMNYHRDVFPGGIYLNDIEKGVGRYKLTLPFFTDSVLYVELQTGWTMWCSLEGGPRGHYFQVKVYDARHNQQCFYVGPYERTEVAYW